MNKTLTLSVLLALAVALVGFAVVQEDSAAMTPDADESELSLITATPDEGFALAIALARRGVTETQPDTEVLHALRPGYAHEAEPLMMASHVIAVHFQTVAAANDYWR